MKLNNSNKTIILVFGVLWLISGLIAYNSAVSDDRETYIDDILAIERTELITQNLSPNNPAAGAKQTTTLPQMIEKIVTIIQRLDAIYVDDVDYNTLMEDAINGMLRGLDPHTSYFTKDDFESFTSSTKGEFGEIGRASCRERV